MLYLKQAVTKVSEKLYDVKMQSLQNSFLFQLVFLSTIKDYLYKATTEESLFVIPEKVIKTASDPSKKKVLVLDMDETLVYTRRNSQPNHKNYHETQHQNEPMYIEERPLLREFLKAVSQIFDVYIYTAGNKQYANHVLDTIDKDKIISKRFFRDNCKKENGMFYKDLKHLKRVSKTRKDMILVDDNTISVGNNYPYSIAIKQFEGDQSDRELLKVFEALLKFYF